jgi:hypothetical protein
VLVHVPPKRSLHPDRRNPDVTKGKMAVDVSDFVGRLRKALAQATGELSKAGGQSPQSRRTSDINAGLVETLRKENEGLRQLLAARDRDLQTTASLFGQITQIHRDLGQALETLKGPIDAFNQAQAPPGHTRRPGESAQVLGEVKSARNSELPKAERTILSVLARHNPEARSKRAIAIEGGYAVSGGGFNNALSRLRSTGMIQGSDPLQLTDAGRNYVAQRKQESMPTGAALAVYWIQRLPRAERNILEVLTRHPRRYMSKEEIALETGYKVTGGGFQNAISRLRTLLLIEGRVEIAASERLFD